MRAATLPLIVVLALGMALARIGARFAERALPGAGRLKRALAGTTLALGLLEGVARVLAALGRFRATWVLVVIAAAAGVTELIARRWPGTVKRAHHSDHDVRLWTAAPAVLVAAVATALALLAARLLPIWAWDAVGYHLPFVNHLVEAGASAAVPPTLPYVGTYPHGAELLFAVLRVFLPDDTWLDAAQIPFGLIGSAATMHLARHWGAPRPAALIAGAAWLSVPAVFLQLPSGYVDVCVAAFLLLSVCWILEAPAPAAVVLAGVSLGLLLASKPHAPLPVAILGAWLAVRCAGRASWLIPAFAAVCLLGLPDYASNLHRFGNPFWPIALDIGPFHLPGLSTRADLLAAGARAPRLSGPLWSRIVRSWSALRAPPCFDMRFGGLGTATVLLGMPAALWRLPARPAALIALFASLAGPDPATARFILAFPALCLALAATLASNLRPATLLAVSLGVALFGAADLAYASPALWGEGPSVRRLLRMSDEERLRAVGPDGPPGRWIDLRRALAPGQTIAFDGSFKLSYLVWRRRLQNRVLFIPDTLSVDAVQDLVARERVRFLIAGEQSATGALVRRNGYRRLFACGSDPCAVYTAAPSPSPGS